MRADSRRLSENPVLWVMPAMQDAALWKPNTDCCLFLETNKFSFYLRQVFKLQGVLKQEITKVLLFLPLY